MRTRYKSTVQPRKGKGKHANNILLIMIITFVSLMSLMILVLSISTWSNAQQTSLDIGTIHAAAMGNHIDYSVHPIQEKPWGEVYVPARIWCLVPTLYPRNQDNMKAISSTWGRHCTKLIFVLDDKMIIPDTFVQELNDIGAHNVEMLQLSNLNAIQSSEARNIWEKVWKMWQFIATHHINDAEWFLKIDDDTFFSAINFHGFAQYFNPDNASYYIGHTLLHEWLRRNIIFNAGACYALSRGVLRRFANEILSLPSFQNDTQRNHDEYWPLKPGQDESKKRLKWEWRNYCVGNRLYAQEDPTMGICLRSIGINPINTLDEQFRQRFHIFRPNDLRSIKWEDTWFWRYKDKRIGDGERCCSPDSISFHSYKVTARDVLKHLEDLDEEYNVKNLDRVYKVPWKEPPTLFLWDKETSPEHDKYWNYVHPPKGQRIYRGANQTRYCHECDWFDIK